MSGGTFVYGNPPVIRWGAGSRKALPADLARLNARRPALVSTRSIVANAALRAALHQALQSAEDVPVVTIGQHAPEAEIRKAVVTLANQRPDALVSLGGGSPIDAAKIIALELSRVDERGPRVRHIAVPTTLSTAELAAAAGMTDAKGDKVGRRDGGMLPDAVIYDAELALHTPLPLWLATGIRALDHAVEGYLSPGDHPLSDLGAVAAIRRLFESLPRAREAPGDPTVRTENQLAAWFSYLLPGPAAAGLSHVMGKQVGSRHGIPHGVTSCLLLPHVLRYRARRERERVEALARTTGIGADAGEAAAAIEDLVARLGLPRHLGEFGLDDADICRAAESTVRTVGEEYQVEDLVEVYRAAW